MNREQAKELLPIIQAWVEGKEIQWKTRRDEWETITDPAFYYKDKYRIKPEKKTGWINIYPNAAAWIFNTKELADYNQKVGRVACIQITYEEGEGNTQSHWECNESVSTK